TAEPLQRDPAPVHQRAGPSIDRKRRLVTEFDGVGFQPPICPPHPGLVQDPAPPQSRSRFVCRICGAEPGKKSGTDPKASGVRTGFGLTLETPASNTPTPTPHH